MVAKVSEVQGLLAQCLTTFDTFHSKVKVVGVIILEFLGDFLGNPQSGSLTDPQSRFYDSHGGLT